jgi:hypothetical protein
LFENTKDVAMSMDHVSGPPEETKPSWRAACLAYRRERQAGKRDLPAFQAALSAFRGLRPDVDARAAHDETRRAIVWASVEHKEWFWRGGRRLGVAAASVRQGKSLIEATGVRLLPLCPCRISTALGHRAVGTTARFAYTHDAPAKRVVFPS